MGGWLRGKRFTRAGRILPMNSSINASAERSVGRTRERAGRMVDRRGQRRGKPAHRLIGPLIASGKGGLWNVTPPTRGLRIGWVSTGSTVTSVSLTALRANGLPGLASNTGQD